MKHCVNQPHIIVSTFLKTGLEYLWIEDSSVFRKECVVFEKEQKETMLLQKEVEKKILVCEESIVMSSERKEFFSMNEKDSNETNVNITTKSVDSFEKLEGTAISVEKRVEKQMSTYVKDSSLPSTQSDSTLIKQDSCTTEERYANKKEEYSLRSKYIPVKKEYLEKKHWDIRFQELFNKSKRTPILWTYFALGEDIFSNPSKNRRETLQTIITSLQMKQGTHSFFPFTAPEENGVLLEYKEEFLASVSMLMPRLIVFFGQEGVDRLLPNISVSMMQEFIFQMPIRAIILPSINDMSTSELHKAISYMKEYIRCISL